MVGGAWFDRQLANGSEKHDIHLEVCAFVHHLEKQKKHPLLLFSNVDNSGEELVTHAATGVIEVGDPDLDEEASLNADFSINWERDLSFAELTFFYNSFEDYIFLRSTGEEVNETPVFAYDQEDAELAWERTIAFFKEKLAG